MPRPTVAEIDLSAIVHNLHALRSLTPPNAGFIAVVKADAYGHGAVPVSRVLAAEGVAHFAVALVEEAIVLHDAGVPGTFLILGVPPPEAMTEIAARGFELALADMDTAHRLDAAARERGCQVGVHLLFDTGMGRIGFFPSEPVRVAAAVACLPGLRIAGALTHFPSAADPDADAFTHEQIRRFCQVREQLRAAGIDIPIWHAANSPAALQHPDSHLDTIRPGLSLYGIYPWFGRRGPIELRPAMTFKTRIAQVRDMPAGATVSYGRTFRTERRSRIAVLPLGYADGYSRANSNRASVLIRGMRAPVIGRVCMDMTMVDATDIPGVSTGDEVVLYGRQGEEQISINDAAELLGTIPYEVMTSVSARVPRIYVGAPGGSTGGAPIR